MVTVICVYCGKNFSVKQSVQNRGNGKYCDIRCYRLHFTQEKAVPCTICAVPTYKSTKIIRRSKSGKFFCGKYYQTVWRNKLYVGSAHKNFTTGKSSYREVMKRSDQKRICTLCAISDIRVLAVHHSDKNRTNNVLENLAWLCHNCHFLVHKYEDASASFKAKRVLP